MSKQVPWDVIPKTPGLCCRSSCTKLEIDNMEETASGGGKHDQGHVQVLEPEAQKGLLYFENFVIGSDDDPGG